MARCKHCKVATQLVETVDGKKMLVHDEPGSPPYRFCKYAVAEVETVGDWANKLLGPLR